MSKTLGVIHVDVIEAAGLAAKDAGSADAFVKVKLGDKQYRTQYIPGSVNPEWNSSFTFDVTSPNGEIKIDVLSRHGGGKPLFLGTYKFTAQEVIDKGDIDDWFTLQKRSRSSKVSGKIHLSLYYSAAKTKDMLIEVMEARNLNVKGNSDVFALIRFGDHEMRTKSLAAPNPKWKEAIKFTWNDEVKDIKVYIKDEDGGDKVATMILPTSDISAEDAKGSWFGLTPAKGKADSEIKLKITIGKPDQRKKKASALDLEPIEDLEASDYSEIEGSESVDGSEDGPFKRNKKKGKGTDTSSGSGPAPKVLDSGRIIVNELEVKISDSGVGAPTAKSVWILGFYFEKQSMTTDPKNGIHVKFADNLAFELKHFSSELKIDLFEGKEETKDNLFAEAKLSLEELQQGPINKKWYEMKIKKKASSAEVRVRMSVTFEPDIVYDEVDFQPEVLPDKYLSAKSVGTVTLTLMEAKGLQAKDLATNTSDPYVSIENHSGTFQTKVINENCDPQWNETFTFKVKTLRSRIMLVVWDKDRNKDEFLGALKLDLLELDKEPEIDKWVALGKRSSKSIVSGELHYKLSFKIRDPTTKKKPAGKKNDAGSDEDDLESSTSSRKRSGGGKKKGKGVGKKKKGNALDPFSKESEIEEDTPNCDLILKVILLGDSGVGKTGLFGRFVKSEFDELARATVGIDFASKCFRIDNRVVKVQISDTAGQERYKAITRQYYRGAMGAILIYDITSEGTFEHLEEWIQEVMEHSKVPNMQFLLVGNKVDQDKYREIPKDQGIAFAKKHDMLFMETSAKQDTNVWDAFQMVLLAIYESAKTHGVQKLSDNPYAVVAMDENVDIVKIDPHTNKTIVLSAGTPEAKAAVNPAALQPACRC